MIHSHEEIEEVVESTAEEGTFKRGFCFGL